MRKLAMLCLLILLSNSCSKDHFEDPQQLCTGLTLENGNYEDIEAYNIIKAASAPFYLEHGKVHLFEQTNIVFSEENVRDFLDSSEINYNQTALENFDSLNQEVAIFKNSPSPQEILLISDAELNCLIGTGNQEDDWESFYKKYPNSYGLLSYSKPGISADGNSAIIIRYRTNGRVITFGADFDGSILVMSKVNDSWQIDETLVFVVS